MLPGASRHVACASGTLSHARFVSLAVSGQVLDMHKSDLRDEEVGFAFLGKFSLSSLLQPFFAVSQLADTRWCASRGWRETTLIEF